MIFELLSTVGIAVALSGLVTGFMTLRAARVRASREKEAPSLDDRITTLTDSLRSASSVISEIEKEISKRSQTALKLREDVQRYEQLKDLSQAEVEAVAQTLRSAIAGESRKSMWRNAIITFVIALVFFFVGWFVRGA